MGTTLKDANREWASRPDDERLWSIQELYDRTKNRYKSAITAVVPYRDLQVVETEGDDLAIAGPVGGLAKFTNYSFGQIAQAVGAPAKYLATLPAAVAAELLTKHGLQKRHPDEKGHVLLHENGSLTFRAITGTAYNRIWNHEIAEFLLKLQAADPGWRVPPARPARPGQARTRIATEADVLDINREHDLAVHVGDPIAPGGVYEGDHNMFTFLVNQNRALVSGKEVLNRGFFVRNSEVGDASLVFTKFIYGYICGNHYAWNAQDIEEISFRHVGKSLQERVAEAMNKVKSATDESTAEDSAKLAKLRTFFLGDKKEDVLSFARQPRFGLPAKTAEAAYQIADQYSEIHGDPKSAWGFVSGLTRLSQDNGFADKRDELDRIGGSILQLVAGKN